MVKRNRRFADGAAPSSGWTGDAHESMENTTLPDTITCALCVRDLPLENYSPSAKKRLISEIRRNGEKVLDDQHVVRCDGCGTQSRSEIHCMTCNQVRSIEGFANTQRQLPQPTCLPCQDILQLDERDKVAKKKDEPVSELTRAFGNLAAGRVTEKNSESAPAVTNTIGMAEDEMRKESPLEENKGAFVPANGRFETRAESWSVGASSASAIRASAQNKGIIGDMSLDTLFDYDDDAVYSSSYQW